MSDSRKSNLLFKLWDMSNSIAAFSIVQSIALTVGLGTSDLHSRVQTPLGVTLTCGLALLGGGAHAYAVFHIDRIAHALLSSLADMDPEEQLVWDRATSARIVAISVFVLVAVLAALAVFLGHIGD